MGGVAPPWEPRQRARKQDGNGTAVKVGTELSNADHIVQWARLQFGSTAPKSSPRALGLCSGVHTCRSTNLLLQRAVANRRVDIQLGHSNVQ